MDKVGDWCITTSLRLAALTMSRCTLCFAMTNFGTPNVQWRTDTMTTNSQCDPGTSSMWEQASLHRRLIHFSCQNVSPAWMQNQCNNKLSSLRPTSSICNLRCGGAADLLAKQPQHLCAYEWSKCTSWHENVRQASERKKQQHHAASTCDNPRRRALALSNSDLCTHRAENSCNCHRLGACETIFNMCIGSVPKKNQRGQSGRVKTPTSKTQRGISKEIGPWEGLKL